MSCGMVRKVDELGRVVIPKEMRRILNIKTGSSIEMFINDSNQVVLKKFSELENILELGEALVEVVFNTFNLKCLIVDDDNKVVNLKGLPKKDFLNCKIDFLKTENNFINESIYTKKIECSIEEDFATIFSIISEGFNCGNLVCFHKMENLDSKTQEEILVLVKFFSSLLKF